MSEEPWEILGRLKVCLGHQSVGEQLVQALTSIPECPVRVTATTDPEAFQRPVFAHFRVGHNGNPLSKVQEFARVMDEGVGNRVDIAFFKLCYVDITSHTDVEGLFRVYEQTMTTLTRAYPDATFLHVTVPLRRISGERFGWLRKRTGWTSRERADQIQRHAYNQMLRAAYGETGRVFDLAAIESTLPDGTPSSVACRGEALPSLVPEYTDDGGHLSRQTAAFAAQRLLSCLKAVAGRRQHVGVAR